MVEEPWRGGPDRRTVAAGLLTLVCRAAEIGPVLVAIDDGQWLDLPTTRAASAAHARYLTGRLAALGRSSWAEELIVYPDL